MTDVDAKIPELRQQFLSKYDGSVLDDTYDARDVEELKGSDDLLRNTLRARSDMKKCMELLNEVLVFRAKFKLRDLKESDLNAELMEKNGVYYKGEDNKGHKILHFRVCKQKKGHLIHEVKTVIAYHFWQHYQQHPNQEIILFFDFVDAGVSNMDMDTTKFIIKCANTYFPKSAAYSLMFKMGITLEAIWKLIQVFLDAEQSKNTHFVKRSNINHYINEDQLEPHMLQQKKSK